MCVVKEALGLGIYACSSLWVGVPVYMQCLCFILCLMQLCVHGYLCCAAVSSLGGKLW